MLPIFSPNNIKLEKSLEEHSFQTMNQLKDLKLDYFFLVNSFVKKCCKFIIQDVSLGKGHTLTEVFPITHTYWVFCPL